MRLDDDVTPLSPAPRRAKARRPWWVLPIFGSVPDVEKRHLDLLGAVALALLFEEYDLSMLTAALPQIAASLSMPEADFGFYLGCIRLGALPAVVFIPYADRVGRRRVFLLSVLGTALTTILTGFSQTPVQFVACQMLTRSFYVTGAAVAIVYIAEEFPAEHRGWGIGMLGALGATGDGIAMTIFSQIERLPWGWRTLYGMGLVPLLLIPFFRKRIPETGRFVRHERRHADDVAGYSLRPMLELMMQTPARSLGIAISGFVPAIGMVGAFQFTGYYAQTVQGWSPGQYAAMIVLGGAVGIIGNIAAGHLADRFGRRVVGMALLGTYPFAVALFYNGSGWVLPVAWIGFLFGSQGGRVILRALATELFPTEQRASASGLWTILEAAGGATGLFLLYFGSAQQGDFAFFTSLLGFTTLIGGSVLIFFPETSQRELEAISH